jgi:hypothetical protein
MSRSGQCRLPAIPDALAGLFIPTAAVGFKSTNAAGREEGPVWSHLPLGSDRDRAAAAPTPPLLRP